MKIMKRSPSIVLLSAVILAGAIVFAPRLQATAAPPAPQVEVVGPLTSTGNLRTSPVLVDGYDLLEDGHDSLEIPAGVALTDLVITTLRSTGQYPDFPPCRLELYSFNPNTRGDVLLAYLYSPGLLDEQDRIPITDLHLESGLRSTENRRIKIRRSAECNLGVLWTGYVYGDE